VESDVSFVYKPFALGETTIRHYQVAINNH